MNENTFDDSRAQPLDDDNRAQGATRTAAPRPGDATATHLDSVLAYVAHGHRVVLLHEVRVDGTCSCSNKGGTCAKANGKDSTGKHPRTKNWLKNLIVDEPAAFRAWGRYPTANVGLCPHENEVVLDIDPRNGGRETFQRLVDEHGEIQGPCAITGGGGHHYWIRLPPSIDIAEATRLINAHLKKRGPGIDLRTCRNQVVVAPSRHKSARRYEWVAGRSILECEPVVPSPGWLAALGIAEGKDTGTHSQPRSDNDDHARAEWGLITERLLDPDRGYTDWFRLGPALKPLGDEGLRLWIEASRPSKDFDEAEIRRKWPGLKGSSVNSLFGMFDDADSTWRRRFHDSHTSARDRTSPRTDANARGGHSAGETRPWPEPVSPAARHGLVGEFLQLVEEQTEADTHALLLQFLTFFGNCVGRSPHFMIGATRHGTNLFVTVTGQSSRGRKGTSEAEVRRVLRSVDQEWVANNICSGLSSGEGLIDVVRDPREGPPDRRGKTTTIPGVVDKRCMVTEGEFARVLAQVAREGNVLSSILRQAWDGDTLRTMVRGNPARATAPHISVVAHVTQFELLARMSETDLFNGLGNRFLWCCSRRTRKLPFGGDVDQHGLQALAARITEAADTARRTGVVGYTAAARAHWADVYNRVSVDRPGLWGALTARAEAQVLRLALIYALLDSATSIDRVHLDAAQSVWDYCDASVAYLFGNKLGHATADKLLAAIRDAGAAGIARTQLSGALGRNKSAADMNGALQLLLNTGLVRRLVVGEGIKATEMWFSL